MDIFAYEYATEPLSGSAFGRVRAAVAAAEALGKKGLVSAWRVTTTDRRAWRVVVLDHGAGIREAVDWGDGTPCALTAEELRAFVSRRERTTLEAALGAPPGATHVEHTAAYGPGGVALNPDGTLSELDGD